MNRLSIKQLSTVVKRDFCLDGINFELPAGQVVGVLGMNGAGKSTLLRTLVGLETIRSGSIEFDQTAMDTLSRRQRAQHIGYLPQHAEFRWSLPVIDAVALGLQSRFERRWRWSDSLEAADAELLRQAMFEADVWQFRDRPVDQLSGGEQMRVHLARLFAGCHNVLAADEPCASLDLHHQLDIMALFREKALGGVAVLTVLHDLSLAQNYCDRLLVLNNGQIALDDTVERVMANNELQSLLKVTFSMFEQNQRTIYLPDPSVR